MDRIRVNQLMIPKYYLYLLSSFYNNGYVLNYIKQTTGIQNLDISSMLASEKIPVPQIEEQTNIVNHLDTKCGRIDAEIAKQDQIIENLKTSIKQHSLLKLQRMALTQKSKQKNHLSVGSEIFQSTGRSSVLQICTIKHRKQAMRISLS